MARPTMKTLAGRARETAPVPAARAIADREAAGVELAEAQAALTVAENAYRAGLLSADEDGLRALAQTQADAGLRRDRASALCESFDRQLAEARAAEQAELDAARRAEVEGLIAAADQAWSAYRDTVASDVADILRKLERLMNLARDAGRARDAAIKGLRAAGDIDLAPPFESFRSIAGRPAKRIAAEEVDLWVNERGEPYGGQDEVTVRRDGSGYLRMGSSAHGDYLNHKREFQRIEELPERSPHRVVVPFADVWAEIHEPVRKIAWPVDPTTDDDRRPVVRLVPVGPIRDVRRRLPEQS